MSRKVNIFLIAAFLMVLAGSAQAQYGVGRFEAVQILADDLKSATRSMYLQADRQYTRYRSDRFVVASLYRLYDQAARFENQAERNYNNPQALRRAYQRLYDAWYEADVVMRRAFGFGYLNREFQYVSRNVHQLARTIPGYALRERDFYDDDDYDFDDDH